MKLHPLRLALRIATGVLVVAALVMENLAIYYSSVPHYAQMGWAIFCGVNGIQLAVIAAICLLIAESHEMEMKQLDREQRHKTVVE